MDNLDYFESVSEVYDDLYNDAISQAENELVVDLVKQAINGDAASVLDLGCGTGLMLEMAHLYAPKLQRYLGIDISPAMVSQLQSKVIPFPESQTVIISDINELPRLVPNQDVFDLCLSTFGSFSYVKDLRKTINDIYSRLKINGVAILMVYSKKSMQVKHDADKQTIGEYQFRNTKNPTSSHLAFFYSESQLRDLLVDTDITTFQILGLNHRDSQYYYGLDKNKIKKLLMCDMMDQDPNDAHSLILVINKK